MKVGSGLGTGTRCSGHAASEAEDVVGAIRRGRPDIAFGAGDGTELSQRHCLTGLHRVLGRVAPKQVRPQCLRGTLILRAAGKREVRGSGSIVRTAGVAVATCGR